MCSLVAKFVSKWLADRVKAKESADRNSLAKKVTAAILEEIRRLHFEQSSKSEDWHKHRVTLFKEVDSPCGRKKILEIFSRAGVHVTSKRTWEMDPDHPDRCRGGVAGRVWFSGNTMFSKAACGWPADNNTNDVQRYATSLGLTLEEAQSLNVKSFSFVVAQVRVNGNRWGIVVVDSLLDIVPAKDQTKAKWKRFLDAYAVMVGRVLAEAGV